MPMVIRSGRCDECRRRKRKCDEARPNCSGCADRRVQCSYSTEVSQFVHLHQPVSGYSSDSNAVPGKPTPHPVNRVVLSIRNSRAPPSGNGLYHTFVPLKLSAKEKARQTKQDDAERKSLSISPLPCSDINRLQNEFHNVLHSSSSQGMCLRILGPWMEMCLPRIGTSPVLDRSIATLIAGHKARYAFDEKAMRNGSRHYGNTLTLLKEVMARGIRAITAEVIAATKILMLFEIMVGTEVAGWISHSYGAINLFLAIGPKACAGEFERMLLYATYGPAWQQGQMIGKPSVFDKPEWLQVPPPNSKSYHSVGSGRRFHVLTRLARLNSLVRSVREDPTDDIVAAKAVQLAEELMNLDWGTDEHWQTPPKIVPTARAEDAGLVPNSFNWKEEEYIEAVSQNLQWCCKIMLSGLCQTLYAAEAPIERPSLAELYEEERRCAMFISMSADYFYSLAPYACGVTLWNLQTAWGVYWRQKDFPIASDGYAMAEWLRRRGNEFMSYFTGKEMRSASLAFITERLMGGPILPPEVFPADDAALKESEREAIRTLADDHVQEEPISAFNEGMRHFIAMSKPPGSGKASLYDYSAVRSVSDYEH